MATAWLAGGHEAGSRADTMKDIDKARKARAPSNEDGGEDRDDQE